MKPEPIQGQDFAMSNDNIDFRRMDEHDPNLQSGLTCEVDINCETGTLHDMHVAIAFVLRELAAKIEGGTLESGSYSLTGPNGIEIGTASLDYYATGPR